MSTLFGSIWWFVVTLGVLVTFHEFGHFWVARRCGVKVLRFSVGFGRPLWSRIARDGTEYQVAMIPLGGYVKMLDEREQDVPAAERHMAFNRQPVGKRIAIVAAGPVANLLLCVAFLWGSYQIGYPDLAPVIGPPAGVAAEAGLRSGDRILAVGTVATPTWTQAAMPLALAAIDRRDIALEIQSVDGDIGRRLLPLSRLPADFDQTQPLPAMGLFLAPPSAVIGALAPDAAAAGLLRVGDEIRAVGGRPVASFADIGPAVQAAAGHGAVRVDLRREGRDLQVQVTPRRVTTDGETRWLLGVGPAPLPVTLLRYGPVDAVGAALRETWQQAKTTLGFLGRLVTGKASPKNLSGAIGIAQAANAEASLGLARMLGFLASLSLTLCILNLLPIPVLDGGHLLYYLIELVSGRPISERVLIAGQYAGLVLLAGLILLANANDLLRLT